METVNDATNTGLNSEYPSSVPESSELNCGKKEEYQSSLAVPSVSFAQQYLQENVEEDPASLDSIYSNSAQVEPEAVLTSDQISSKSTSVSELEDGQIVESSSSECSDVFLDATKSSLKRRCSVRYEDETDGVPGKRLKKKISFSAVTAYYFPRAQGFTCVPSQGGSTLGMALKHTHVESLTLSEHAAQQRKNHRR
jgi:hypothetical protein